MVDYLHICVSAAPRVCKLVCMCVGGGGGGCLGPTCQVKSSVLGGSKGAVCSCLVHWLVLHGDMGNIGNHLHLCACISVHAFVCAHVHHCLDVCQCVGVWVCARLWVCKVQYL